MTAPKKKRRNLLYGLQQFIAAKWQTFRAWQEHPVSYRLDEKEHVCNNCGHTFRGNYCPMCSQSARHGRITWLAIWQGIGQLWGIESRSAIPFGSYSCVRGIWYAIISAGKGIQATFRFLFLGNIMAVDGLCRAEFFDHTTDCYDRHPDP